MNFQWNRPELVASYLDRNPTHDLTLRPSSYGWVNFVLVHFLGCGIGTLVLFSCSQFYIFSLSLSHCLRPAFFYSSHLLSNHALFSDSFGLNVCQKHCLFIRHYMVTNTSAHTTHMSAQRRPCVCLVCVACVLLWRQWNILFLFSPSSTSQNVPDPLKWNSRHFINWLSTV